MPANRNQLPWNATVKAYPAVADLQSIESFVRVLDTDLNVGAPSYTQDAYTVPAGKIFVLEFLMVYSMQADPTSVEFIIRSGGTNYTFFGAGYGAAWSQNYWIQPLRLNESEILRIVWNGTLAGTDVVATVFGYLIDKY